MKKQIEIVFILNVAFAFVILSILSPTVFANPEPYLQYVKEYRRIPLIDQSDWGRLNLIVYIYKLLYDGVPNYDWYFYEIRLETVPGKIAYNSDQRNDWNWAWHKVYNPGTLRWLVDHSPTTTSGTSTVSVSLSAAAGLKDLQQVSVFHGVIP